jgi:hypothetical protein
MRRALFLLATLLASCSSEAAPSCPGTPIGQFTFEAAYATTLAAGLDPMPVPTTCSFDPAFPTTIVFSGTLTVSGTVTGDPEGSSAALCRNGPVMFGKHTGPRLSVEITSDGAVLGSCGLTCAARSRTIIEGDVGPDPEAPTTFKGALVEQLTESSGDCTRCVLPCAARYELTGTTQVTP